MNLDDLLELVKETPVTADIHPVSLCYLPGDITVFKSASEMVWLFDRPDPTLPGRFLSLNYDRQYSDRFPHIRCDHDPFTPALNAHLFERYADVAAHMLRQSNISDRIVSRAREHNFVILILIDGLSYRDIRQWHGTDKGRVAVEPCLVDVPTFTQVAFPNLIGDPSLAMRLFNIGYHHRLGFTYWTRESNQLTDQLYRTIPDVIKTGSFPDILDRVQDYLARHRTGRSYIQIVRMGLDSLAHRQKRSLSVTSVAAELRKELDQLIALGDELCGRLHLQGCIYLTADHGILWRDEFEVEIVGNAPPNSSARWCHWRDLYQQRESGYRFVVAGEEYFCLGFPKLRRPLHIDEQGVHGGISFQESIIPFVTVEIGKPC